MTTVEVFAPAKINLTLHVTGRRPNGFHELHSLVVFASVGDVIRARPEGQDLRLSLSGPRAPGIPIGEDNIVLRAATFLRQMRNVKAGAVIDLEKHLPHGAGIGGGSADAAATIHALAQLWQVTRPDPDELLSLGADVPVCLAAPAPVIFAGVGEIVQPAPGLPRFSLVLVHPGAALSTPQVFRNLDIPMDHAAKPMIAVPSADEGRERFFEWLAEQRNDLTPAALDLCPGVRHALEAIGSQFGCRLARMSGSGSTCWGLFDDLSAAERAAAVLRRDHPNWWVEATDIVSEA